MSERDGRGDNQFISHPNTRTLHRGTREVGAECGQPLQSGGWGRVDAENPVDAVLTYGTPPCTKCFKHTNRLNTLYLIEHSARVVRKSKQDVLDLLPWDEPEKELATDGGEEVGRAIPRVAEGELPFRRIRTNPSKWTFQPHAVRKYVEGWLDGRVLNLFAGHTELRHDGEIVRNDLDEDKPADYHFDAVDADLYLDEDSFDTVVLDPPWNSRKSREKYRGEYQGHFTAVKDTVAKLVKPGGHVLTVGYDTLGLGKQRGFKPRAVASLCYGGDINDALILVEQRVEHDLSTVGGGARAD